jgi:sortase (surface protein transpeptidase)
MRPAAAGVVLGLALAVGVPTTWAMTRPSAAAGAPVVEALEAPAQQAPAGRPELRPDPLADGRPDRLPEATARPAAPTVAEKPAPVRITAPDLGVDAPVDAVGVQRDGSMTLPEDVDHVGWYRFGPAPGQGGSAVLAGHVDDVEQGLGALAPIRGAEVGAELAVTDAEGTTTRWRVVARDVIRKQALPLDELFRRDGPPRLTLLTCGGPFLAEYGSYRDNVVVVAEPLP